MPPVGTLQAVADNPRSSTHPKFTDNDRAELEKLDAAVARMQKHTRPDPYVVTIDQDRQCQYQYQWRSQQYQWLHGTPFRYEEGEGVQYQTFVFQEPGSSMLSLHAQYYPEDRPGTADSTRNVTGANTPAQCPKKVISFGAYKKKQTGETPTRESISARDSDKSGKQPAVKGPAERVKAMEAESADMIKAVEEDEKAEESQKSKGKPRDDQTSSKKPELKRKREENPSANHNAPATNGHRSPPPSKKARSEASEPRHKESKPLRSPSPIPARRSPNKQDADMEVQMPPKLSPLHNVPPKLSPLHDVPPKLSPLRDEPQSPDNFELPPRISPDLPDNITATLRATDEKSMKPRPKKSMASAKDDGVRGATPRDDEDGGHKISEPHHSKRNRSRSPERPEKPSASKNNSKRALQAPQESKDPDNPKKPSLLVRIKIKKSRKEDVQRILRLPARPDKHMASPPSTPSGSDDDSAEPLSTQKGKPSGAADKTDQSRRSGKGVAQKVGPASRKIEERRPASEKRPRAEPSETTENSEPPAKRKRTEDAAPEPPAKKRQADGADSQTAPKKKAPCAFDVKKTTSTPVPPPAPSPAVSSVQKSQLATPVARKDLLHPKREASTDSQSGTPSAQSNTPTGRASQPNGLLSRPPSSNPQSAKSSSSQAWDTEQKRLETLGRDLKHAASDLLKNNKPSATARRLAAVKSIESLICYLLAFTCSDRAALLANNHIPLRFWRSLPPFCAFVGRTTENYATLSGLASGLGVVIYSHILDIATRNPAEAPSRDSLLELSSALHKAAVHAEENLDIEALMGAFSKTWAARTKTSLAAPSPGDFGEPRKLLQGGYRLPLGVQTDALQAARAGLALVKEWIAREGLEYEFRLGV